MTTDKLMLFASDGRAFALPCDKLPPGRGTGEPLRLMLDLDDKVRIVAAFAHRPGRKRLVASAAGYGFLAPEDDMLALRRAGKQVLNLEEGGSTALCLEADGDHVAVVGTTGKALIFPAADLPEMGRGKGVSCRTTPAWAASRTPSSSARRRPRLLRQVRQAPRLEGLGRMARPPRRRRPRRPKTFARFDRPR
jgi:DNA gyrase/topoisomerase IV subunit A